jgi:hypothetical protein
MSSHIGREIYKSIINESHRWSIDRYHYRRDDGIVIWIANGTANIKVEKPKYVDLPWIWRRKIWKATKIMRKDFKARMKTLTMKDLLG